MKKKLEEPSKPRKVRPDPTARGQRDRTVGHLLHFLLDPVLESMRAGWPELFPRNFQAAQPYSLDIHDSLFKAMPQHRKGTIRCAVAAFMASESYQKALSEGGPRYGLDGKKKGTVTPGESAAAERELQRLFSRRMREKQKRAAPR